MVACRSAQRKNQLITFCAPESNENSHYIFQIVDRMVSLRNCRMETPKPEKILFKCKSCNLKEKVDYKGSKPGFARSVILKEDSYVMKDPFSSTRKGQILIIGSDCSVCDQMVCQDKDCSIFYTKTFCILCAKKNIKYFPVTMQNKIKT